MPLELHISQYCALANSKDFHAWLKETADDLMADLEATLKSRRGCRVNKEKMLEIYKSLYERHLGDSFEKFIKERFPFLIKGKERSKHAQEK